MAQVTSEEMQAMQESAGKDNSSMATKLAQEVAQGLSKLSEMLDKSKSVTDADRAQMQKIMSLYVDLVEKKLGGSAPGEDQPEEVEMLSQVPSDAGTSGVPMGPASRN